MTNNKLTTMAEVEDATKAFFSLHWNNDQLGDIELPKSWLSYGFVGAVPFGNCQGCYALIKDDEVIYIGLGASRGEGIYEGHGIGARLNNHVLSWDKSVSAEVKDRVYRPQEKWADVSEIFTFGFPPGFGYLACSFEAYLISKLEPVRNVVKISTAKFIQPNE